MPKVHLNTQDRQHGGTVNNLPKVHLNTLDRQHDGTVKKLLREHLNVQDKHLDGTVNNLPRYTRIHWTARWDCQEVTQGTPECTEHHGGTVNKLPCRYTCMYRTNSMVGLSTTCPRYTLIHWTDSIVGLSTTCPRYTRIHWTDSMVGLSTTWPGSPVCT